MLLADFSVIEFLVYGVIGYGGVVLGMITVLMNPPTDKTMAGTRAVMIVPSIICLSILMFASGDITTDHQSDVIKSSTLSDENSETFGYNSTTALFTITSYSNTTTTITTSTNSTSEEKYILINPEWGTMHLMFFLVLLVLFSIQVFNLLTKV